MSSSPVIVYHSGCNDGFCSAWIANKFIGQNECYSPVYIPLNYGDPIPYEQLEDRKVYLLDFSFKREILIDLLTKVKFITIIDHHKTAEEDLKDLRAHNLQILFDMEHSGCRLTYEYFTKFKGIKLDKPWVVDYVEDRDLWKWKLPNSKEINTVISTYDHTFEAWDQLEKDIWNGMESIVLAGTYLLKYKEQLINRILENKQNITIDDHNVEIVNTPIFQSEIGEKLCQLVNPKTNQLNRFGISYYEDSNGLTHFSLRSRDQLHSDNPIDILPAIDVSEIAKKFGGGGHKQASGFEKAPKYNVQDNNGLH